MMRHYEIVILIHPDHSDQAMNLIERYRETITSNGGLVHRCEDWGRRSLAYPIEKLHKAHYVLLNIEAPQPVVDELRHTFRYNQAILRSLLLRLSAAVTEPSAILKPREERRDLRSDGREHSDFLSAD